MKEPEMVKVAEFLHRAVQISLQAQQESGSKLLKDFVSTITGSGASAEALKTLKQEVEDFATQYPLPGIPDSSKIKRSH
jgi:glycine hydroxymethyltransferase